MENIELQPTVDRALELLAEDGASSKMLKDYTQTGFGRITRHFRQDEIVFVTEEMLEDFVLG